MRPVFIKIKKRPALSLSSAKGYSLVETIAYVTLLTLIVSVIVYAVAAIFRANSIVRATRNVENSSIASTDRMIREIRAASSIDATHSVLGGGTTSGVLTLVIPSGAGTRTVKFYLANERLMVDDNGITTGPLTLSNVHATSLQFFSMATSTSDAIKFELTLIGPTSDPGVSEKFYGTAVLRGGYTQ